MKRRGKKKKNNKKREELRSIKKRNNLAKNPQKGGTPAIEKRATTSTFVKKFEEPR